MASTYPYPKVSRYRIEANGEFLAPASSIKAAKDWCKQWAQKHGSMEFTITTPPVVYKPKL